MGSNFSASSGKGAVAEGVSEWKCNSIEEAVKKRERTSVRTVSYESPELRLDVEGKVRNGALCQHTQQ